MIRFLRSRLVRKATVCAVLIAALTAGLVAYADSAWVSVGGVPTYVTYNSYGLKARAQTSTTNADANITLTGSGSLTAYQPGYISGKWLLFVRDSYVILQGKGYYKIRWEPEYWVAPNQQLMLPTFTVTTGTNLFVAQGGRIGVNNSWFRYAETNPVVQYNFVDGLHYLDSAGNKRDMEWQDKYYYLDGTVKIVCNERRNGTGAYNIAITPVLYSDITAIRSQSSGYLDVKDF
ncbi:hypothetical protein [Cohnella sp. GbtcB17]|uniref:hypothetical protein n=1 Tax=Cohnella sp. GbtcB17 TaxID=2824762 RepID=UPI001C2F283C|nr:hypothetical protein [Cohnella sp. GbtcB17]